jgi:hypothetical protein
MRSNPDAAQAGPANSPLVRMEVFAGIRHDEFKTVNIHNYREKGDFGGWVLG